MADATILVADDHANLRVLVRTLLSRTSGWTVIEAADGDEALDAFHDHEVDLVILDQRMPGLSGSEVARELRERCFEGPIVLFSAYLDQDVEDEAIELGLVTLPKSEIGQLDATARRVLADGANGSAT